MQHRRYRCATPLAPAAARLASAPAVLPQPGPLVGDRSERKFLSDDEAVMVSVLDHIEDDRRGD